MWSHKSWHVHDADIAGDVVQAVAKINQLCDSGQTVSDYLAAQGFFADDLIPEAQDLVRFLDQHQHQHCVKAIFTLLSNIIQRRKPQETPRRAMY